MTYCWKSPTSSQGSSPTSSMIGDGLIIRKPYRSYINLTKIKLKVFYRMASSIIFGNPEKASKKKRPLSYPGIIHKNTIKLYT